MLPAPHTAIANSPQPPSHLYAAKKIVTGPIHYHCILTTSKGVLCWGNILTAPKLYWTYPDPVEYFQNGIDDVVVGVNHACALTENGAVMCWGRGYEGQLGNGSISASQMPTNVIGLSNGVRSISVLESVTCAVTSHGSVMCWGVNYEGGYIDNAIPRSINGMGYGIQSVTVIPGGVCGITEMNGVRCSGDPIPIDLKGFVNYRANVPLVIK